MRPSKRKISISSEGEADINPSVAIIKFQCNYETIYGQNLYISGNIEELGAWQPKKAMKMVTNEETYPIWESETELTCPVGMTIEYKYIVISDSDQVEWEKLPMTDHRTLTMKKDGEYIILNCKGDTSIKAKRLEKPTFTNNLSGPREKGEIEEGFFKLRKLSFESASSAIISSQEPIDLISYQNNKRSVDMINDSIDFTLHQKITNADRIIMTSQFLPVEVYKKDGVYNFRENVESSVFATMNYMKNVKKANLIWVGMLKDYFSYTRDELDKIDEMLQSNNYFMIYPDKEEWEDFIIYLQKIIFPIFTDYSFSNSNEYLYEFEKYFKSFHKVSQLYAEIISVNMHEKDLIILNGMVLGLVPNALAQKNHNASIGIYLHTPLPPSDILKSIPKYKEIIKSLLLCDVIGFHLYSSARNFMTILKRYFGLFVEITKKGFITVNYFGRIVLLHIKQGQVDVGYLRSLITTPEFSVAEKKYADIIGDKFTFFSLDHLNLIQLLATKLGAIESFFDQHPQAVKDTVFILWVKCLSLNDKPANIVKHFENQVNKLRKKFNNDKIIYFEYIDQFPFIERLYLFQKCNILVYPFYFEGHCIYANEFIAMQSKEKKYFLILGENICATIGIHSIFKTNPFEDSGLCKKMGQCYEMKFIPEEAEKRFEKDFLFVKENSSMKWVKSFLLDMKRIKFHDSTNKIGMGMGLNFKIMKFNDRFSHLTSKSLIKYYKRSERRIFFLDYENTLIQIDESSNADSPQDSPIRKNASAPTQRLLKILKCLSNEPKNLIFILSKYETEYLSKFFAPLRGKIGLSGENGFFYKYPDDLTYNKIVETTDWSWIDTVSQILKVFTEKTEGSYVVRKNSCISWVYKNCDSYFGKLQADEIKTHLLSIFNQKLDVVIDGESVEIKPKNVNKGAFIATILQNEFRKKKVDFIFAVGDDNSDEESFRYLKSAEKYFGNFGDRIKLITSTISRKPSEAKYYLNEVNECIEYLELLAHDEFNSDKKPSARSTMQLPTTSFLEKTKSESYTKNYFGTVITPKGNDVPEFKPLDNL